MLIAVPGGTLFDEGTNVATGGLERPGVNSKSCARSLHNPAAVDLESEILFSKDVIRLSNFLASSVSALI